MIKKLLKLIIFLIIVMAAVVGGDIFERAFGFRLADKIFPQKAPLKETDCPKKSLKRRIGGDRGS